MDGRSMETQGYEEEDEDEIRVLESDEEEEVMKIEGKYEDDDEDFKELNELIEPKVTSWSGADGKIIHGIVVFNDDLFDRKISCQMDICPICYHAWTAQGKHRICCLPCGHMYGLSCIINCLVQSPSCGKCPQCNTLCSNKDVILLYASRLCISAQHKTSSARFFPFTKQGYEEFKINEQGRRSDAQKLIPDLKKRVLLVFQEMQVVEDQYTKSVTLWNDVKNLLPKLEQRAAIVETAGMLKHVFDDLKREDYDSGMLKHVFDDLKREDYDFKMQADILKQHADELERRGDALKPRAHALERRLDALCERVIQYRPRLEFFVQMYKEHQRKIK